MGNISLHICQLLFFATQRNIYWSFTASCCVGIGLQEENCGSPSMHLTDKYWGNCESCSSATCCVYSHSKQIISLFLSPDNFLDYLLVRLVGN
ncbi:hypothetical protein XELAEV_18032671mg [Xenopus laevis]|uniref:Uncharacterized protein n=1 Tax=Xenopus laevis TaxID=8355 RepID=A0A974CID1_XENLA|nr:hypothetical protein XELAEV_18032671mg [Xenopus laevis]